ncbi:hypothetical protein WMY93_030789 [Mugilogobius chulae]|uniref:receptor protein-tyrosine kinase n=1 Tax=Mugilogobius chulae TaxID=88201 RepID=A0AAW0MIW5_9GOBI
MDLTLFCLLCGLYSVLARDGRYSAPVLDVKSQQLVLNVDQTLLLNCRGRWKLSWVSPPSLNAEQVKVANSRCGRTKQHYCSRLTISQTLVENTGLYKCYYEHRPEKNTSVYVYISDSHRPFVEHLGMSPDVLYKKDDEPLIFPCRVTHPNTTATLNKFPRGPRVSPDERNILWDSTIGFTVRSPTLFYTGAFFCETSRDGASLKSRIYFVHRPVSNILEVYLNSSGSVQALKGERLVLNCTATGELNTRVNITWDYPGKNNSFHSITKRIQKHRTHVLFYSILTIPNLQYSDRGQYSCRVSSGDKVKHQDVPVTIYDHPFIRLKPRHGCLIETEVGQKSYKISPKLRAFPVPEVIWLKDGRVAAEQCSRYHLQGHSLVIRDVAEEDAGKYTILVRNQEHGLCQNLTLTLVVKVKPQIGEKAVSLQDPGPVPQGSRQSLHCTSHGIPPPHIHWSWHPCPVKGLCECPLSSSLWTAVTVGQSATSTQNHILSVSQRHQVLQGKNKTVGVLTVAEASVSGVYRCVASNSAGTDHRTIHFYVTDVKGGFSVAQEEQPREGGDLHLTCRANRHLYSALSWKQMNRAHAVPAQLSVGEYSSALVLLRHNLSATDSGVYRCSAQHLPSGQQAHLDIQVNVSGLEPPVILNNLTDSTVNSSSSVTLKCLSHGVPPPTVTWYKGEQELLQGSGVVISPEDGTLHIDRITEEDQGLYTCKVTNERGSALSSAHIWVNNISEFSLLEIPTLTCTCVVATLLWLLLTLLIRKLRQKSNTKPEYLSIILDTGEGPLREQCQRLQYDASQWEFPRERLKLGKPLGRGAFGKVVQASAYGIENKTRCRTVAVKMLKEGATVSEHKALMTELKILNHIGNHLNVVNLLGACTKPGGPLMVIVEYCRFGNLSNFLKTKRGVFVDDRNQFYRGKSGYGNALQEVTFNQKHKNNTEEKDVPNSPLFLEDLISFSLQVARGMDFLASRKCIHRDLAARNVLLSDNKVVKICDFGLARDIYRDPDYIRKGDARLPLKWMSPESIFDKVFTTQSDIWSFGVLLWEIFSLGASPYPGLHIDEEFCHRLKEGTRMRAPRYSTPEIYSTMLSCWEPSPSDRPAFSDLVETLGDLLQAQVRQNGKDYIPLEEQSDSGMVLPSEELKSWTENNNSKLNSSLNFTEVLDDSSPPPDYNASFIYSSL